MTLLPEIQRPREEPLDRTELQVERLYHLVPAGQWFYTPDGIGLTWFDSREAALEETGAFGEPIIQVDQPTAD